MFSVNEAQVALLGVLMTIQKICVHVKGESENTGSSVKKKKTHHKCVTVIFI